MYINMNSLLKQANSEKLRKELIASHWDSEMFSQHRIIIRACRDTLKRYPDSIIAKQALYYAAADDIINLLTLECDPSCYDDATKYLMDAQIVGFIKKVPWVHKLLDPRKTAIKTFIAAELQCKLRNDLYFKGFRNPKFESKLLAAQKLIGDTLRDDPSEVLATADISFSKGVTRSTRDQVTPYDKMYAEMEMTPETVSLVEELLQHNPRFCEFLMAHNVKMGKLLPFKLTQGDSLDFVPKSAKTHRTIAYGPLWNVVLQRIFGRVIRESLVGKGIVLKEAQALHKHLARESSIHDHLATIDLSAASDTISTSIVMELLPHKWFSYLYACRSPKYEIEGKWYTYSKFSAMGNGYTFELESMLFWSLACACVPLSRRQEVRVYGDDIIMPKEYAVDFIELLRHCGFSTNVEKSFIDGKFKESCGGDFMNGTNVRPFNSKEMPTLRNVVLLHNHLARTGKRFLFKGLYDMLSRDLRESKRVIAGPSYLEGDGHIVVENYENGLYITEVRMKLTKRRLHFGDDHNYNYALYKLNINPLTDVEMKGNLEKWLFSTTARGLTNFDLRFLISENGAFAPILRDSLAKNHNWRVKQFNKKYQLKRRPIRPVDQRFPRKKEEETACSRGTPVTS